MADWGTAGGQTSSRVLSASVLEPRPTVPMPLFRPLQAGGRGGGGLHPHPASPGRGAAESPRGGDGPQGGRAGHLPLHGPGSAEVPAHHPAAALPQHGEHPAAPGLLHHQQHDPQGAAGHRARGVPLQGVVRSANIRGFSQAPMNKNEGFSLILCGFGTVAFLSCLWRPLDSSRGKTFT